MPTSLECKHYLKGGHCSHRDAPNPGHSWCIGSKYEDYLRKTPCPLSTTNAPQAPIVVNK